MINRDKMKRIMLETYTIERNFVDRLERYSSGKEALNELISTAEEIIKSKTEGSKL